MEATKVEREWRLLKDDEEFATLFANAHIVRATTERPPETRIKGQRTPDGYQFGYLFSADLYWELSDGRWLAMESEVESDGYESGGCFLARTFYTLDPE